MADLFVRQAEVYTRARPRLPEELFSYLASLTPSHAVAWDVGTGNGQAAVAISKYYEKVIATDVAAEQLKYAERKPNVTYRVTPKTLSRDDVTRIIGPEGSVDLVLIAEALHWFAFDSFHENVKHVLRKPGGLIAATVYPSRPIVDVTLNIVLDKFYSTIEHYWSPQITYVENGYKGLPFPFSPVKGNDHKEAPQLEVTLDANFDDFVSYLRSWSAVQTAVDNGHEPLNEKQKKIFADAWGPPETVRCLRWPLTVLLGTV